LRQLSSEELCGKLRETGKPILSKVADIFEEQELDGEDLTSIIYEELCVVLPKLGMRLKLESFLGEMGITMPKILPEVEERPRKKRKLEFTSASNSNELDKKLWIRGVPKEKNNIAQISMFFSTFGNIENLQIMREQKGAVLQFSSAEEVTNCIEDCSNEVIMGERSIRLERYITFEEENTNKKTDTLEEVTEDASIAEEPVEELEEAKSTESVNRVSNKHLVEKATPSETTGCPGPKQYLLKLLKGRNGYSTMDYSKQTFCKVCRCVLPLYQYNSHIRGVRHRSKLWKMIKGTDMVGITKACYCGWTTNSVKKIAKEYSKHFGYRRHQRADLWLKAGGEI